MKKEQNFRKEKEESRQTIQRLQKEIDNLKIDSKYHFNEKENLSKDPLEFYDIIGNINSMQNVNTDGWDFYMNKDGCDIVKSTNDIQRLVIGVMGNRNKGKSFILQALSGATLKTGTTINTIGISIKYLDDRYVLLDCAGSESPLLGESANMLEISRDKLFTEAFLESYILRKSNVLLLVVGILSFSEQKLINKISKDLEKLEKIKEQKNLIVIHNLQTYETIDDVQKYIKETLLKSASFKIKREQSNFADDKDESEFFYDIENPSVKHFIYAKENSVAGKKYNVNTINSIKSIYQISTSKYKYDYKETIIEHFKYMSEKMFDEGNLEMELMEITQNDDCMKENNKANNDIIDKNDKEKEIKNNEFNLIDPKFIKYSCKLKYNGEKKLSLKKMVIDELGISSFINNDFIPNHEMYCTDKELIINIECPNGTKITVKKKRIKIKSMIIYFALKLLLKKRKNQKKKMLHILKLSNLVNFILLFLFLIVIIL